MRIEGGGGDERFYLRPGAKGEFVLAGEQGDDIFIITAASQERQTRIIDDSAERQRMSYFGSVNPERIQITDQSLVNGLDQIQFDTTFAYLEAFGFDGDDQFELNRSPARTVLLSGLNGKDEFRVDSTQGINGLRLVGGQGESTVHLNQSLSTTFTRIIGASSADHFIIGNAVEGDVSIDGFGGADNYDVQFVGSGDRWVGALDSGSDGVDTITVQGTPGSDDLEVRGSKLL